MTIYESSLYFRLLKKTQNDAPTTQYKADAVYPLCQNILEEILPLHTVKSYHAYFILFQVSPSAEHQEFYTFLQRILTPVLEAYSGAAIFVHSLSSPMSEREYTHKLFKYLLTRTERGVAAYGEPPALSISLFESAFPRPP